MRKLAGDLLGPCLHFWRVFSGSYDSALAVLSNGSVSRGSAATLLRLCGALKTTIKLSALLLEHGAHSLLLTEAGQGVSLALGSTLQSILSTWRSLRFALRAAETSQPCDTAIVTSLEDVCSQHDKGIVRAAEAITALGRLHPLTLASCGASRAFAGLLSNMLQGVSASLQARLTSQGGSVAAAYCDSLGSDNDATLPVPEEAVSHALAFLTKLLDASQALSGPLQQQGSLGPGSGLCDKLREAIAGLEPAISGDTPIAEQHSKGAREISTLAGEVFAPATHSDWLRLCVTLCFPVTPHQLGEWRTDSEAVALGADFEERGASLRGGAEALLLALVSDERHAVPLCTAILAHAQGADAAFLAAADAVCAACDVGPLSDTLLPALEQLLLSAIASESAYRAAGLAAPDAIARGVLTAESLGGWWAGGFAAVSLACGLPQMSATSSLAPRRSHALLQSISRALSHTGGSSRATELLQDAVAPALSLLLRRCLWVLSCSLAALPHPLAHALPELACSVMLAVPRDAGAPSELPVGVRLASATLLSTVLQNPTTDALPLLASPGFLTTVTRAALTSLSQCTSSDSCTQLCGLLSSAYSLLAFAPARRHALVAASSSIASHLAQAWWHSRDQQSRDASSDDQRILGTSFARQALLGLLAQLMRPVVIAAADARTATAMGTIAGNTATPAPWLTPDAISSIYIVICDAHGITVRPDSVDPPSYALARDDSQVLSGEGLHVLLCLLHCGPPGAPLPREMMSSVLQLLVRAADAHHALDTTDGRSPAPQAASEAAGAAARTIESLVGRATASGQAGKLLSATTSGGRGLLPELLRVLLLCAPPHALAAVYAAADALLLASSAATPSPGEAGRAFVCGPLAPLCWTMLASVALGKARARFAAPIGGDDDEGGGSGALGDDDGDPLAHLSVIPPQRVADRRRALLLVLARALLLASRGAATQQDAGAAVQAAVHAWLSAGSGAGGAAVFTSPRPFATAAALRLLPSSIGDQPSDQLLQALPGSVPLPCGPTPGSSPAEVHPGVGLTVVGTCVWLLNALTDACPDVGGSRVSLKPGGGAGAHAQALCSSLTQLEPAWCATLATAGASLLLGASVHGIVAVSARLSPPAAAGHPSAAALLSALPSCDDLNPLAQHSAAVDALLSSASAASAAVRALLPAGSAPRPVEAVPMLLAGAYSHLRGLIEAASSDADEQAASVGGGDHDGDDSDIEREEDGHLRGTASGRARGPAGLCGEGGGGPDEPVLTGPPPSGDGGDDARAAAFGSASALALRLAAQWPLAAMWAEVSLDAASAAAAAVRSCGAAIAVSFACEVQPALAPPQLCVALAAPMGASLSAQVQPHAHTLAL